jgi:hypothetical protein
MLELQVFPAKIHSEMLEFLADCVGVPQTWKVLRQQLMPLFYHVILPALWLNAHDQVSLISVTPVTVYLSFSPPSGSIHTTRYP